MAHSEQKGPIWAWFTYCILSEAERTVAMRERPKEGEKIRQLILPMCRTQKNSYSDYRMLGTRMWGSGDTSCPVGNDRGWGLRAQC